MGKMQKSRWTPPKNYQDFFVPSADEEFKEKHPIGYFFLTALGIVVLLLPSIVFVVLCVLAGFDSAWILLGVAGGLAVGIGLFNFVSIIMDQYLGHLVSIISFLLGGIMMLISWLLCR